MKKKSEYILEQLPPLTYFIHLRKNILVKSIFQRKNNI